jgi:4-amino-4-deoxy-L-arabinose transferase-like glycosyltransferase
MPATDRARSIFRSPVLWGIVAAGLALRVYAALVCRQVPDYSDMGEYNRLAVEGLPHSFRPPLYPLFLRGVYSMFGAYDYRAAFLAQSVLSIVVIPLLYAAASRLWNRRAGLIAAGLAAVYPAFIAYNVTTLTESLSILCVALMIWAAASTLDDRRKAIAQGALAAFGILMKPAFVFFVPGLFATLRHRLVFVLVLSALLAPWLIGNAARRGPMAPVSESGAIMFYRSYNPAASGDDIAVAEPRFATPLGLIWFGLEFIAHNPLAALDIVNHKVLVLLAAAWDGYVFRDAPPATPAIYALRYAYVVVFILGFIGLARHYRREHRAVVWPVASYLVLVILLSAFKVRYRVLIEPILIVYASILLAPASARAAGPAPAAPREGGT